MHPFVCSLTRSFFPLRRAGEKLERSVDSLPVLPITLEEVEERIVKWRVRKAAKGRGAGNFPRRRLPGRRDGMHTQQSKASGASALPSNQSLASHV